jgi:hypothetical protein
MSTKNVKKSLALAWPKYQSNLTEVSIPRLPGKPFESGDSSNEDDENLKRKNLFQWSETSTRKHLRKAYETDVSDFEERENGRQAISNSEKVNLRY